MLVDLVLLVRVQRVRGWVRAGAAGSALSPAKAQVVHMSDGLDFSASASGGTQEWHEQVVRLHLHRPANDPIGEGGDPPGDPVRYSGVPSGKHISLL